MANQNPPQDKSSQAEHTMISASIELDQLDDNLFRSSTRYLWVPSRARGVFGGQVISQALVAATKTIPEGFHCHSLHCYFLESADASVPIIYYVDRTRQGKSFLTRGVKASQRGRTVFIMLTSFSKIEYGHPEAQWPAHFGVRSPRISPDSADQVQAMADAEQNPERKQYLMQVKQDRLQSPIEIRVADDGEGPDGVTPAKYWMRARNMPKSEAPFQKCILAYLSDLLFLNTVRRSVRGNPENGDNTAIAMMASLDHSLWFYDHEFDCSEWILFVMDSPRVGLGRGIVYGVFYNIEGKIIAAAAQEAVARRPKLNSKDPNVPAKNKL